MNPLTNMKNVLKLSEQELRTNNKTSWHDQYRTSAWVFIGGLPFDLTEGDIICIFSQYGEMVNINLIRDKDSGKSKGFCFLCYEDQRSTDLAVDNFNGIKILNRIIRVDHVENYKIPKHGKNTDAETKKLYEEGCAPKPSQPIVPVVNIKKDPDDVRETLADQIETDIKLPRRLPICPVKKEPLEHDEIDKMNDGKKLKHKKSKKKRKKKKSKKQSSSSDSDDGCDSDSDNKKKKKRKHSSNDRDSSDVNDDNLKEKKLEKQKVVNPRRSRSRSRERHRRHSPDYRNVKRSDKR